MTHPFANLFSPLEVGSITLKNRIFLAAHATLSMPLDAPPNEKAIKYWEARARGGASLIITGVHLIMPGCTGVARGQLQSDNIIEPFSKAADAIHHAGAKVFAQLGHVGRLGTSKAAGGVTWGPSAVKRDLAPANWEIPHEMTPMEIKNVIDEFAKSASRIKKAGYDGIEIQGAAGMLIAQFLSPHMNKRSDEYGGSLENRLRFASEIVEAVRAAVGSDFVVGIKIAGDEFLEDGASAQQMQEVAIKLEETGTLDYINVGAGAYINIATHVPPMYFPLGCFVYLASGIKEVVDIPVFSMGRINDPVQAEEIISNYQSDMVGMVRGMICDPQLPNKAKEGRLDEIRKCLGCEEGCYGRYRRGLPVGCAFNPEAGREAEFEITAASVKKEVLIVGGGAAGLETARVASMRGHHVTLYEQDSELGGQMNIARLAPGRDDFSEVSRYYTHMMKELGVDVHLDTAVDETTIVAENADVVVVATGSLPARPDIPGVDRGNVFDIREVLQGNVELGEKVLVVAADNHIHGLSVADYLSDREKEVSVITDGFYAGQDMPLGTLQAIYTKLLAKGVDITPLTSIKEIRPEGVVVCNVFTEGERIIEDVDSVVLSMGGVANNHLLKSLDGKVGELYGVGQSLSPRYLLEAILDGARLGRKI